ncbi:CLAVATA3/ESR (CLE)-related protein 46 isoform X2 [Quercus robur]|uniref:CLAVATA3/ESR (CLE)-related protein 46 isoform X2 n=1 Tax=Quercus robur TaxID=38942 RepID=UPI002163797D|nr:CLAVATA3/ESR (CLE)-related protein 46 isoform X2 [Quercus robur]
MHQLMRKMRRQTLIHLLLAWLLATSQHSYFATNVQAVKSVHFRFRPGQLSSRSHNGYALSARVRGKNNHKIPSGPNPVGNHRPPSRK